MQKLVDEMRTAIDDATREMQDLNAEDMAVTAIRIVEQYRLMRYIELNYMNKEGQ